MIMIGKPSNIENYICVNSDIAKKLHELNFQPVYRDMNDIYFTKTDDLLKVVKEIGNEKI